MTITSTSLTTLAAASPELLAAAKYIRELDPSAEKTKTQKLLYITQGSYLAQTGRSLFPEAPKAWQHGPVYSPVYAEDTYRQSTAIDRADTAVLTGAQEALIKAVVETYRSCTAYELSQMTHEPGPWRDARGDISDDTRSNETITHEAMMRFFSHPGRAVVAPGVAEETSWGGLPAGWLEEKKAQWADLLERLAS